MNLLVQRLDPQLPLPQYAHPGDAGLDLQPGRRDASPGERSLVPTGLAIALPAGYAAFVHPRSGWLFAMAWVVNGPGTIDAGTAARSGLDQPRSARTGRGSTVAIESPNRGAETADRQHR